MTIHRRALLGASLFSLAACASAPRTRAVITEPIAFDVSGLAFNGTLYRPDQSQRAPLLIVYHAANGGSADTPFYNHLKHDVPARGVAAFIWNRRGANGQPGDFTTATFEDLARDGIAALNVLKSHSAVDPQRIGAYGISQGGWIAPLATTLSDDFAFSIPVSGPAVTPARQMDYAAECKLRDEGYSEAIIARALELRARINAYYRAPADRAALQRDLDAARAEPWFEAAYFPLRRADGQLPDDPSRSKWRQEMDFDPLITLSRVNKPLLAMFGEKDRLVPVPECITAMRATVRSDLLNIWTSPTAGHLMETDREGAQHDGDTPVEPAYVDAMLNFVQRR